jgi:hypothetical protein
MRVMTRSQTRYSAAGRLFQKSQKLSSHRRPDVIDLPAR